MYAITSREELQVGSAAGPGVARRVVCPSTTETDQRLGRSPAEAAYAIRRPSGDHVKLPRTPTSATFFGAPPSALMTQMVRGPLRSDTNAICCPSGEKDGRSSSEFPEVSGRASEPSNRAVHRCRLPARDEAKTNRE